MLNRNILDYLRNFKDFLTEAIQICKSIFLLILNNRLIVLLLIIIFILFKSLNYLAYEMPKSTVKKYYYSIDNKQFYRAWNMHSNQSQVRWKERFDGFSKGYSTFSTTAISKITNYNPGSLIEALTADKKQLIVDLIVIENFRNEDIIQNNEIITDQSDNVLWLKLRYRENFNLLEENKLPSFKSTLKIVRKYKKVFTITRDHDSDFFDRLLSHNWLITDIENKEVALVYDAAFLESLY